MLCDTLLGPWADPAKNPKFEPDVERLIKLGQEQPEGHEDEIRKSPVSRARAEQVIAEIGSYLKSGNHLGKSRGIGFDELPAFKTMLGNSQKFFISPEFAKVSLQRFATPETLAKAKDWFQLIHDPMWLEWHYQERPGLRLGALFYSRTATTGEKTFWCYLTTGLMEKGDDSRQFTIYHYQLLPETARAENGGFYMDVEADEAMDVDTNDMARVLACYAYDFIIRINSPRITEFRACDDLSKINKKRMKLGRAPLCSYQIVDLNRAIKAQLRQADTEGEGGVRFHWRRGHFKLLTGPRYKEPGLHWWTPHTAGRKVYGEIDKEYVA